MNLREAAMFDLTEGDYLIPAHMREGVRRYVIDGIPAGDFLMAVFRNDFMEACARADEQNLARLANWARFLFNYCPRDCYGSAEAVKNWRGIKDENA